MPRIRPTHLTDDSFRRRCTDRAVDEVLGLDFAALERRFVVRQHLALRAADGFGPFRQCDPIHEWSCWCLGSSHKIRLRVRTTRSRPRRTHLVNEAQELAFSVRLLLHVLLQLADGRTREDLDANRLLAQRLDFDHDALARLRLRLALIVSDRNADVCCELFVPSQRQCESSWQQRAQAHGRARTYAPAASPRTGSRDASSRSAWKWWKCTH